MFYVLRQYYQSRHSKRYRYTCKSVCIRMYKSLQRVFSASDMELPDRNIWIYTGFTYDKDLVHGGCRYIECTDEILDNTDILVDGRFIETQRDLMLNFRGSRNQRIIDMKQTRKEGNIILSSLN